MNFTDFFNAFIMVYAVGYSVFIFYTFYKFRHQPKLKINLLKEYPLLKKLLAETDNEDDNSKHFITQEILDQAELRIILEKKMSFEVAEMYKKEIEYYKDKIKNPETILPPR